MARWTILEKNHNHNKGFKVCNYYNVIKLIKQVLQLQSDQHVERSAECGRICPLSFLLRKQTGHILARTGS